MGEKGLALAHTTAFRDTSQSSPVQEQAGKVHSEVREDLWTKGDDLTGREL